MKSIQDIAVVGGGPAGLRAAEVAATGGAGVTVYDAMRSVGRKFLVAGKSGLNLTNDEAFEPFLSRYRGGDLPAGRWREMLSDFDNRALREWAAGLGIDTFAANSGKVFPVAERGMIKAAPLLRRWVKRLRTAGVAFRTRHRWTGIDGERCLVFEAPGGEIAVSHDAWVLAPGGASWPQTGSDGSWVNILQQQGVAISPLTASNCGWEVDWPSEVLKEAEGLPLKNLSLRAGDSDAGDGDAGHRGELVITRYGLEGGPLYRLGPELRSMDGPPRVFIDFKPDLSADDLVERMGAVRRNFVREARRRWKLDPATGALLKFLPNQGTVEIRRATSARSKTLPHRSDPAASDRRSHFLRRWRRLERTYRSAHAQEITRHLRRRRNDRLGGTDRWLPDAGMLRHRRPGRTCGPAVCVAIADQPEKPRAETRRRRGPAKGLIPLQKLCASVTLCETFP